MPQKAWKKTRNSHRLVYCLLLSLLLHGLALWILPHGSFRKETIQQLVRFQPEEAEPVRFEPKRALGGPTPRTQMEKLVVEGKPSALKVPTTELVRAIDAPEPSGSLSQAQPRLFGGKGGGFVRPVDTLLSIEEINLAMLQLRLEELAGYDRLWLPDADKDDAESDAQQRGRKIVLAAVEAMGGVRALNQLQGMSLRPAAPPDSLSTPDISRYQGFAIVAYWTTYQTEAEIREGWQLDQSFFRKRGLHSQFARTLPGNARLVYDGARAWMVLSNTRHQVTGERFRVIQNQAERWDFLSRYLGDGVQVTYLEQQENAAGKAFEVVKVEDFKFGGVPFRALFDETTHLPVSEEYPADDPTLQNRFLEYGKEGDAWVWHQVERNRQRAGGRDTLAVEYGPVPDEIFSVGAAEPAWISTKHAESEGVLWVTARFEKMKFNGIPVVNRQSLGLVSEKIGKEYRRRALRDTARYYLSLGQKRLVEKQVRGIAVEEVRQRGFFSRVEPLTAGAPVKEEDYILEVRLLHKKAPKEIRGRVFFGAEVVSAGINKLIMQDGPWPDFYFGQRWGGDIPPDAFPGGGASELLRPECGVYRLPVYMVEDSDVAYVSDGRLRELLARTYVKMSSAVSAYQQGKPLLYLYENSYCNEP